jgi:hypothetical protein
MKRLAAALAVTFASGALAVGVQAADEFDQYRIESASVSLSSNQAGAHPDITVGFSLSEKGEGSPYALTRDIAAKLPPGMIGNPQGFPSCSTLQLGSEPGESECPQESQVGVTRITLGGGNAGTFTEPIYSMPPPGGDVVARFGFFAGLFPALINVRLDPDDYGLIATAEGVPAAAALIAATTTFWGVPAATSHDSQRITPAEASKNNAPPGGRKSNLPAFPFMTSPTSCGISRAVTLTATSYQLPSVPSSLSAPFPAITGCGLLGFGPDVSSGPTTEQATTGSGLDYELNFPTKGLEFPNLPYDSELKRTEVILPEGVTVNPSEAEGLGVCSPSDYAREAYNSTPNQGCPETSKIGSVTSATPVLDREATGSLYLAKPYDNPFGSLLALYMVLKIPDRGVSVKLAGKITSDPRTGQLTTVFDDIPQLPVANFRLHFREGARAPLVTPAACGTYPIVSRFTPWSDPGKVITVTDTFNITSGVDHGSCPSGSTPPFHPGLVAGTLSNSAGSYSPFDLRLTRNDSEQEITHFSIKLPPGLVGKLAGIPFCSDVQIAAAKARTGPNGGGEEITAPSCPTASEIGRSLAGAGVGDVLVYAPGKVYLAGPYNGSALSIVSITAAKAGPFDLGTVVVREALKVNPETAEVFVDATGSDPIPHIIQGIPVHLRDIRVYVDRPQFILNPTNCERTSTASTVLGSGTDFGSEADDRPITITSPFQAADCASLGFKPKLALSLKGGTKRDDNPAFKAVLTARPGDANIGRAQVTLPHSEFLDQSHIKTICTRVQFAAGNRPGEKCPAGSIYGYAKAITPILDEPVQGPVFLRSSIHPLPDLVAALHNGQIDFNLVGRIDSVKNGRIRNTFELVPDVPVKTFTLTMQGGKKGLLVNSVNLCRSTNRAIADFQGQNGKKHLFTPVVEPSGCRKGRKGKGKARPRRG